MKVLICVPHFYAVSSAKHALQGSSQDPKADRVRSVQFCLTQLLSLTRGYHAFIGTHSTEPMTIGNADVGTQDGGITGDIVICTHGDDHVLDAIEMRGFRQQLTRLSDSRFLGYACRWVFANHSDKYDLFMYVEDDTAVLDPEFLLKVQAFYRRFGDRRVLLPHRYELFSRYAVKTYLDQPAPIAFRREPDFADEAQLRMPSYEGDILFDRTTDYSTGCYVITRGQLAFWMAQDDFRMPRNGMNMDALEQAGGALGGRYPVYKPALSNATFLEVHHVPNKACNAKAPQAQLADVVRSRLDAAARRGTSS